jgi:hypothetical protein
LEAIISVDEFTHDASRDRNQLKSIADADSCVRTVVDAAPVMPHKITAANAAFNNLIIEKPTYAPS